LDDAYDASFIDADFETIWNLNPELSDEEKTVFPSKEGLELSEKLDSMESLVCGDDPVLTTAGLEELLPPPLEVPCPLPDSSTVEQHEWANTVDDSKSNNNKEEEKPEFIDYPIEIHAIHSYSLPPSHQNMLPGDEVHYNQSASSNEDDDEDNKPEVITMKKQMRQVLQHQMTRLQSRTLQRQSSSEDEATEATPVIAVQQPSRKRPAPQTSPVLVSSRRSSRVPKRPKVESESEDEDDENTQVAAPNGRSLALPKDTFSNGKKKLYKSGPFRNNPEMERARINAINAKRNRDRKKQEKQALEQEMTRLRNENQGLKRTAANFKERAASAESELQQIRQLLKLNNLEAVLKAAGNAH